LQPSKEPRKIYLKLDIVNGLFNFMSVENQTASGRYAADRSILSMSGLNVPGGNKIAFDYISAGSACTAGTAAGNTPSNCGTTNGDGTGSPVSSGWDGSNWQTDFEVHHRHRDDRGDHGCIHGWHEYLYSDFLIIII
jgi:hypothetical protein